MNLADCQVVLRPRTPLETMDLSFRLLHHEGGVVMKLAAAVLIPALLLLVGLGVWSGSWWVALGVSLLIHPWLQAPFGLLASRVLFASDGGLVPIRAALWQRAPRLLLLVVLWCLGLLLGVMTMGLGLPMLVGLMFVSETLLIEPVPWRRAVSRAWLMSAEFVGKALLGFTGLVGLGMWWVFATELLLQSLIGDVFMMGRPLGSLADGQPTPYLLVGWLVFQPFCAFYRFLLYVDIRTCLEGWDLQVALRATGERT